MDFEPKLRGVIIDLCNRGYEIDDIHALLESLVTAYDVNSMLTKLRDSRLQKTPAEPMPASHVKHDSMFKMKEDRRGMAPRAAEKRKATIENWIQRNIVREENEYPEPDERS